MIVRVVALAALLALSPLLARAETLQETMTNFGLIGIWSRDCNRPVSSDNLRAIYAVPSPNTGNLTYTMGPQFQDNNYAIFGAERVDPVTLLLHEEFAADRSRYDITLRRENGRIRTFTSQNKGTGEFLIRDGVYTSSGGQTDWLARCN